MIIIKRLYNFTNSKISFTVDTIFPNEKINWKYFLLQNLYHYLPTTKPFFNRNIYFFLVMWRLHTEEKMVEELVIKSSPVNWILREANFTVTISSFVLAFKLSKNQTRIGHSAGVINFPFYRFVSALPVTGEQTHFRFLVGEANRYSINLATRYLVRVWNGLAVSPGIIF